MASNPLDAGKSTEQLLAERSKRLQDAIELKQPDRIPINMPAGYLLAEYGGITHREQQDNLAKAQELLEKFALEFEPDSVMGLFNSPRPSLALGDRMTKWPGYGLPDSGSFQFNEHEFMKGEDYDEFLRDPSDWAIRRYLPRAFKELEGLQYLPPLSLFSFGHYFLPNLPLLVIHGMDYVSRAISASKSSCDGARSKRSAVRRLLLRRPRCAGPLRDTTERSASASASGSRSPRRRARSGRRNRWSTRSCPSCSSRSCP